jgi:rhamnose utilization protein RhaD (predicted bifunctional aldolase and dehydrogenase)
MKNCISNLVFISNKIGNYPQFVQGGGGNLSVKINEELMAIKASGFLLKDVSENNGLSFVNYSNIKKFINDNHEYENELSENEFDDLFQKSKLKMSEFPDLKPSIETGFHSILPQKYIIHTHSVFVNILCCSKEGEGIVKKLFPSACWVNYGNPGKGITFEIFKEINKNSSNIIFMKNHGIIVCSNDHLDALMLHKFVNDKIIDYLNIKDDFKILDQDAKHSSNEIIFPDQIVYLTSDNLKNSIAGKETIFAINYILKKIKELNYNPNFIDEKDVEYIKNMESEKYRKSLIKL